jgi:hypothetical protein
MFKYIFNIGVYLHICIREEEFEARRLFSAAQNTHDQ